MRQKKIKDLTKEKLNNLGVVTEVRKLKLKENTFIEIGSGKGKFITSLALAYPNNNYIAFEVNMNVCLRIIEKKNELNITNLKVVLGDANNILEYLEQEVLGIYLNFSDPWPKKRHHKRRLSSPLLLEKYQKILKKDGFIQFRTDHYDFFIDTKDYFSNKFNKIKVDINLSESPFMTEYEEKKRKKGPIYQMIGSDFK